MLVMLIMAVKILFPGFNSFNGLYESNGTTKEKNILRKKYSKHVASEENIGNRGRG